VLNGEEAVPRPDARAVALTYQVLAFTEVAEATLTAAVIDMIIAVEAAIRGRRQTRSVFRFIMKILPNMFLPGLLPVLDSYLVTIFGTTAIAAV